MDYDSSSSVYLQTPQGNISLQFAYELFLYGNIKGLYYVKIMSYDSDHYQWLHAWIHTRYNIVVRTLYMV